ncbi:hypothetical protein [Haloarcula nitratireducens]|uniref:Uncharacterized protein n=1 Tax=Haloarcula nitratireducens TaxID=2487749 RepID=A0AAW4PFG2_9EURY|nr:hypothetical protein [Halomicroarcula nitratireducens]MBX0296807.1 hypothetical protein [Halomicroarcula nitratireducens]
MKNSHYNVTWLLTESLRIGAIVLLGFLLAHVLSLLIEGFAIELLYGIEGTLVTAIRYTTLLTALLYVVSKGVNEPTSATAFGDN